MLWGELVAVDWANLGTDARIHAVADAWTSRSTAGTLGKALGVTRNTISGIYDRHGKKAALKDKPLTGRMYKSEPKAAHMTRKQSPRPILRKMAAQPKPVVAAPVAPSAIIRPVELRIPLIDIGANQCKFAITEDLPHLFCGAPSDGSWCPWHRRIVYQRAA